MQEKLKRFLNEKINDLKSAGFYRERRILQSEQSSRVRMGGRDVIMFSSNNYLGLASHPEVKRRTIEAVEEYGCGTASGPQTSGTTILHDRLAKKVAEFTKSEAALIFNSCTSAVIGLLTSVMGKGDVILSDQLNHACIIDGCILSRAETKVYAHNDMNELEKLLKESQAYRFGMIITDGVFSMEGELAPLPEIIELAQKYDAITVIDDSHGTGVIGQNGRGTCEYFGVEGKIDIQASTFGKAMGSAAGGYIAGSRELIDFLYNKARSFIYTNALPPAIAATALAAFEVLEKEPHIREKLHSNTEYFKQKLSTLGFKLIESITPIIPILVGEKDELALKMSNMLFEEGIFVKGFVYPTVPKGKARLRVQISAAHSAEDLDFSIKGFRKVGKKLGILPN